MTHFLFVLQLVTIYRISKNSVVLLLQLHDPSLYVCYLITREFLQ